MKTNKIFTKEAEHELAVVTVAVPCYGEDDAVTTSDIAFRVFKEEEWLKAVPQAPAEACKIYGLPDELIFSFYNQVVLSASHTDEEVMNVIKNIILELQVLDLL